MNYQELEDKINQNTDDISSLKEQISEADLVGGIGGLSFPLDPLVSDMMDKKTLELFSLRIGSATLVGGTVTVSNPYINSSSIIIISRKTTGGTLGYLSIGSQTNGSFIINSSSSTDTSVVNYLFF